MKDLPLGGSTTCRRESLERVVGTAVKLCILGELGFLNCNDVCMCVVNKQFELLECVSESVYVDLQYDEIFLTFTAGPVYLYGVCSPVVVLGLFVRLS